MGGNERHVLVVEDEPGLIELFEIWLSDRYAVTKATTGEEALSAIDDAVDIVILDWRLPDLSGDEILAEVRDRGLDPAVVVVTGAELNGESVGSVDRVLHKPIGQEGLLAAIEDLLAAS